MAVFLAIIAATAIACYSASLHYGFVYDDQSQIAHNPRLYSLANAPSFFVQPIGAQQQGGATNYYRPLFLLWLALNYAAFGLHPLGWHATTILMHVLCCWMVFWIARRLGTGPPFAFLAALLFAVHPAHVESVAWVSGVTDPLLGVALAGCYLLWAERRHVASMALFACALLMKETAIIFPLVIFAHEFWLERKGWLSGALACLPTALVATGYLALRQVVLHHFAQTLTPLPLKARLATVPSLLAFDLRQLVWPQRLALFHDLAYIARFNTPRFWIAALIVFAVACFLLWISRHDGARRFSLVWIIAPLLPTLDVSLFPAGEAAHDRYLYLPSIGLCLLAGLCVENLWDRSGSETSASGLIGDAPERHSQTEPQPAETVYGSHPAISASLRLQRIAIVLTCTIVILAAAVHTAIQSTYWADDLILYAHAAESSPDNMAAANNLGAELYRRNMVLEAETVFRRLQAREPDYWQANYNLGLIYMRENRPADALPFFRRAIALNPTNPAMYIDLAHAQAATGDREMARQTLRSAIARFPNSPQLTMELHQLQ